MYSKGIKRILDFILALIFTPLVGLIYLIVAVLIKIDDGGAVLYKDVRIGRDMNKFEMYKFRSMIENAPDVRNPDGSTYNSSDDIRLTKIGRFLRTTSIDELPQLINILKGDMSFVGPRPSPLGNTGSYPEIYFRKFTVRPGITGYNQAILRNSATLEQRFSNDLYYVDNISFILDAKIIWMTVLSVLKKENIWV